MTPSLTIEVARKTDRAAAFRVAFQHLPAEEQHARVEHALDLVQTNEIDPAGVLVARRGNTVVGSVVCMPTPGAGSLVWPPQVAASAADRTDIEDRLLDQALRWLRSQGAKLAQAMLGTAEVHLGSSLARNGFPHITTLYYLRVGPDVHLPATDPAVTFVPFAQDPKTFGDVLMASYEDTADCPELSGARTIDEVLEGHRAQGIFEPQHWWLARRDGMAVGVLILTRMPEWDSLDVAYVGVVAPARRRGLGRQLMAHAAAEARALKVPQLTLSVDRRNTPAYELYTSMGFTLFDQREVFLAVWGSN